MNKKRKLIVVRTFINQQWKLIVNQTFSEQKEYLNAN